MSQTQFLHGTEVLEDPDGVLPVKTVNTSVIGFVGTAPNADAAAFPLNTPVLLVGRHSAKKLRSATGEAGVGATLPEAVDAAMDQGASVFIVVRTAVGADDAETAANVLGASALATGVHALTMAESVAGFRPRILAAPGFTSKLVDDADAEGGKAPNQVANALASIAEQLKAVVYIDGPNTDETDAINAVKLYGSARVYMVDPHIKRSQANGSIAVQAGSAVFAGIQARVDNERGFWHSVSNKAVRNIQGTARAIDFAYGSTGTRANVLNEGNVGTIIRNPLTGGFNTWGNRGSGGDPRFSFLCVRRTADAINESILRAHLPFVDEPITRTMVSELVESVNQYIRTLKALNAIVNGIAWADKDLNTADLLAQGKVVICFKFTPVYAAEQITFKSILTNEYITEVL